MNGYAKHYNSATAAEDYGVPLVLSEDINKSYKRNSVAEVYQRIEEDLKEAIPNLRTITPNLFRASKLARSRPAGPNLSVHG
ncbi:MAG: RagB/SusD family nutrient uptake outer membrane protein [Odoribacter splanchnicus]